MEKLYEDRHGNEPRYDGDNDAIVEHRQLRNAVVRIVGQLQAAAEMAAQVRGNIFVVGMFSRVDPKVLEEIRAYADLVEGLARPDMEDYAKPKPEAAFGRMSYLTALIDGEIVRRGGEV